MIDQHRNTQIAAVLNELYALRAKALQGKMSAFDKTGICWHISAALFGREESTDFWNVRERWKVAEAFEGFSGCKTYPVKAPVGYVDGEGNELDVFDAANYAYGTLPSWRGEYGDNRMGYLQHLITHFESLEDM